MRKTLSASEVLEAAKEGTTLHIAHNYTRQATVEEVVKKAQEDAALYSLYHATEARFRITQQEDGYRELQPVSFVLANPAGIPLTIHFTEYAKKYYIGIDLREVFKNVTFDTIRDCKEKVKEPQNIGVLSAKKVGQWVAYWMEVYELVKAKDEANGSEKEAFLKSIEGLPVRWFGDKKKQGEIVSNGIVLEFTISETYVSKTVKVHYQVPNTIQSFLALSANNYKAAK